MPPPKATGGYEAMEVLSHTEVDGTVWHATMLLDPGLICLVYRGRRGEEEKLYGVYFVGRKGSLNWIYEQNPVEDDMPEEIHFLIRMSLLALNCA